jgi:hypothetical protein
MSQHIDVFSFLDKHAISPNGRHHFNVKIQIRQNDDFNIRTVFIELAIPDISPHI